MALRRSWHRPILGARGFFDKVGRDWETAWTQQVTPWELQAVNPSFVEGLAHVEKRGGRALQGWAATGLDISPTAVAKARAVVGDNVRVADFFTYSAPEPFDLVYDYLFFAAIEPEMRGRAAAQFKALLHPTSGVLLTLLFPYVTEHGAMRKAGPPYELSLQDYKDVLEPAGLTLQATIQPSTSIKPRRGRELLAFWGCTQEAS
ncbi:hypothetical protein SPRG_07783 [Saprolegnia parasitica CBS 223.65]|uniref:Thiopurine S-methyltransferase n=1 Tax=Saprolegnia parasitica (strain CBS 223.65) TaxID=695850 RepID=A0A067C988_SAPPC|nr:hypothetical protein SPRG_07783 [Saprolegnia parasitica CBS 223.65]KDO27073.1 hypothetical protein SPRG_07783 [Saprolegnia parasitica CBS 223.65]|eukprot:XP_012202167.1 hypothetical protein SPRG_07783 [Saprolegnia parasitica CBS 223.65]